MSRYSSISILGAGSMGSGVARQALKSHQSVSVWNRTRSKAEALQDDGAAVATTVADAIDAADIVVVLLLNYEVAQQLLWPEADRLEGKTVLNLSTGTAKEAEVWAEWAEQHHISYVDGGILATPDVVGQPDALFLLSGHEKAYDSSRSLLDDLGSHRYFGEAAGTASLYDTALLTAMYGMIFGFLHGSAVVDTADVTAVDVAESLVPFMTSIAQALPHIGAVIDGKNYLTGTEQTIDFTQNALGILAANAKDRGIDSSLVDSFRDIVEKQRAAGHGADDVARTIESFR